VSILREIISENNYHWIIAKSYDMKDHLELDKSQLEKLIDEWLQ
jgi:hypothetical protein